MQIFLICSVRGVSEEDAAQQAKYVADLERNGHFVHYPPRDTDQTASGIDICRQNFRAIEDADQVHVYYNPASQGTHFDMGMAFALGKPVFVANAVSYGPGNSFARMLVEWDAAKTDE